MVVGLRRFHVCVLFLPINYGHQVRWTYQPGSHRRRVTQAGFFTHLPSAVRVLIFLAGRIQRFLSIVDRVVEFCVLTINRSPFVGHFYLFILFFH